MRVKVKDGGSDGESHLVKFDPDGGLDALKDAVQEKLGFKPHSLFMDGALVGSVNDLEDKDELTASREAPSSSLKRPAEGEPEAAAGGSSLGSSADRGAAADAGTSQMTLCVSMQDGSTCHFKVKPSTKISKVLKAFNKQQNVPADTFRYLDPEGDRIPEESDKTVKQLELEDGDNIDAMAQQEGGGRMYQPWSRRRSGHR